MVLGPSRLPPISLTITWLPVRKLWAGPAASAVRAAVFEVMERFVTDTLGVFSDTVPATTGVLATLAAVRL